MNSKTETRKQTIASTVCFNSQSSLFLSDMVGLAPALLWWTINSTRVDGKLIKPFNRKGPEGLSETHCPSADLEKKTSELLIGLKNQTHQENQSPSAVSFPLSWAKVENPFLYFKSCREQAVEVVCLSA